MSIQSYIDSQTKRGVFIFNANAVTNKRKTLPSGSLLLDRAIGTRGYPVPKLVQIYGEPSSGKSTLTYLAEAMVTSQGFYALRCDTENDLNCLEQQERRRKFGVNLERCIDIPGNQSAEVIMDTALELLEKYPNEIRVVTVDSISALTSTMRSEKKLEKGHIDDTPRLVANFCKKLNAINQNAVVFMISHTSANIGSMSPKPIAKGGKAVQFYAALRLWVKGSPVVETKEDNGFYRQHQMDIVVEKNKHALPGGRANNLIFDNYHNVFDTLDELITLGKEKNIITVGGSWYEYNGTRAHGRNAMREQIGSNADLVYKLFEEVTGVSYDNYYRID